MTEIRASTVLPARRSPITLRTSDGLRLVGEPYVRIVLTEIVRRVNPAALPLPAEWKDLP